MKILPTRAVLRWETIALTLLVAACASSGATVAPRSGYRGVARELTRFIQHERQAKGLPALSIALVDGDRIVWAQGFGMADPAAGVPATADTVYRVGSVSKLFTDIAMMQLEERGGLDLDAPVTSYLPEFRPRNPFEGEITLRQLTSHRSGLLREPPVGNYFEDTEPSLAETVASLNETELVVAPGTRTKYSNAGIAVVGRVLEKLRGEPYAELMRERVLRPMGLVGADFVPTPEIERRLAVGRMWAYDGREYDAPTFQLGMAPAGSLYASVLDLGRFLEVLFAGGQGPVGRVLERRTLERMLTPTRGPDGKLTPYGIGFHVDRLDGHRRCGHGGAIYGFATTLTFLPEAQLGAVIATSMDASNAVTGRIAAHALRLMLAAHGGRRLPHMILSEPIPEEMAGRLEGRYRAEDGRSAELQRRRGRLILEWNGARAELRRLGRRIVIDGRTRFGTVVEVSSPDSIQIAGTSYERLADSRPDPCPERWRDLIGEYGWEHNTLFVRERDGQLEALIEWFWFDRLRELERDEFALPDGSGLYPGEHLVFRRDAQGRVTHAVLGAVAFARRSPGAPDGETFRIEPVLDPDELLARASAASAPRQRGPWRSPDLVELTDLDPGLRLDVRYAGQNNFMGTAFYSAPRAFMQRPAAQALVSAHRALRPLGYGLLIHDAYRPWHVTKMFWDATPESMRRFVADPSEGSRHNRGCAVDLTLFELSTGEPVLMTGGYDEFSERSYPDYPGGTSLQRWRRNLLRRTMEAQGFSVYEWEWWHFDYRDWREYPILDVEFESIG